MNADMLVGRTVTVQVYLCAGRSTGESVRATLSLEALSLGPVQE